VNIPFQVKVPIDIASALNTKLDVIRNEHAKDVEQFSRALKGSGDSETIIESQRLGERAKRISMNNLIRLCLLYGAPKIIEMKPVALLGLLAEEGAPRGRPVTVGAAKGRAVRAA